MLFCTATNLFLTFSFRHLREKHTNKIEFCRRNNKQNEHWHNFPWKLQNERQEESKDERHRVREEEKVWMGARWPRTKLTESTSLARTKRNEIDKEKKEFRFFSLELCEWWKWENITVSTCGCASTSYICNLSFVPSYERQNEANEKFQEEVFSIYFRHTFDKW